VAMLTKQFKEELIQYVNHPDRANRIANAYGLDLADYFDLLD
jgi:hypothetical protein